MAKMDRRQKGILLVTIFALLFLGWQVYSLIKDDLTSKPVTTNLPLAKPQNSAAPSITTVSAAPATLQPVSVVDEEPKADTPRTEKELPPEMVQSLSFPARPEYLRLATQYEMAKMQRQLLEEEVAIANAKAQIAKLGTNAMQAGGDADTEIVAADTGLQLVSVAQQAGSWTATINQNGTYQVVEVGSRLPPDIEILAIDNDGVMLSEESTRKKLTFNGMIILSTPPNSQQQVVKKLEQRATHIF
ncbi:MAG TPA: hypothetical protein VD770_03670 [Coxiellaceae bacterium]|nr:hypothetical protein [Coxiellaceae bacterium]